jgi:hypothetical protein
MNNRRTRESPRQSHGNHRARTRELYGIEVSPDLISAVIDAVLGLASPPAGGDLSAGFL